MGILRNASKALLIAVLTIAFATADDNPFSFSLDDAVEATDSNTSASVDTTGTKRDSLENRSRKSAAAPIKKALRISQKLFFSPNSSVANSAKPETGQRSGGNRQRMQFIPKQETPATCCANATQPSPAEQTAADPVSTAIMQAVAEADSDGAVVRQVVAHADESSVDFAENEQNAGVTFDDADLPELQIQESSADSDFQTEIEAPGPVAETDISFESDRYEPEVLDPPSAELIDSDSTTPAVAGTVVPNTDGGSLPSRHTGSQQPSVEVQWSRQGTLNVGQKSECSLIVTNRGGSLVRNVTVEAAIPGGIDVVSAVPGPQPGTSRWSVGDLESGESRSIEMVMIPRRRGDVALNAFVRFTGYSTSVLSIQEPLLRTILQGPASVTVGEQAGYNVRVENPGNGTAHNVVIEAQVPDGLQHRSGSAPRIHVGTLNAGESRQALLNLTALAGGQYQLAVRAVADGGLSHQSRTEIMIARPSLEVSIAGPDTAAIGQPADYEVTVTNTGNIPSINVRAKYRLPEHTEFVRADRGGVYQKADRLVDWFAGTIQPGESASYHVTLAAESPGTAVHRAGVKSEHTDITMVSHSTTFRGVPKLHLHVATAEPMAMVGEEAVVRIVVQNQGSMDAGKVGLICELPSGLEFTSADGPSEFLAQTGVVIFRSIDAVQAGDEAEYVVRGRCLRPGNHRIRVRVGSSSLSEPVIGEGMVSAE